ncbi:MAG TPA: hypothetical protein VN794_19640 [Methylomirabilota bacterium]|nr:hypothetical protein [Methylomirabilota bacterium]
MNLPLDTDTPPARATPHTPRRQHARVCLLVGLLITVVVALHLRFFLASPSGRFPVLDGAENISLAQRIAQGTLPAEPFFRAMLYPGLLALFLVAGVGVDWLPAVASIFGCCFHLGSTVLVYKLARRAWASPRAGLAAAGLFGLNPVAIYFATEPLDTTFGLFLFLAGLVVLHRWFLTLATTAWQTSTFRSSLSLLAGGTVLWVLAMLARPHYAITLATLPILIILALWRAPRRLASALAVFGLVAGAGLGMTGLVQKHIGGRFRIMPTQGAYSLWVGNRPGANGRYYEQQIHLAAGSAAEGDNPARVESELLYRRATSEAGPLDIDRMNHYWRSRTRASIKEKPLEWVGLMARKSYYLFNNFEQYNNKTFAIQKTLSPPLRWDPLGWGITLILCAGGLSLAARRGRQCRGLLFLAFTSAAYGAGVVLFFVSDRFRLPLLPMLCVGAGFWGMASIGWLRRLTGGSLFWGSLAMLAAALMTFSRGWGVHDLTPAIQDYVLLSIAARKAGEDEESLRWARRALREQPDHPDALACAATAFYNLKLQGTDLGADFGEETWEKQVQRVARIPQPADSVRLIQAVATWKTGHPEAARDLLRKLSQAQPAGAAVADDALGVLLLANLGTAEDEAAARARAGETSSFYLLVALRRRETPTRLLIPPARRESVTQMEPFVRNLFP